MRIFFLFTILLFPIILISQSTLWDYNEETVYENGEWGRWVFSTTDIKISNLGGGEYQLAFYEYRDTHPYMKLNARYDKTERGIYIYKLVRFTSGTTTAYESDLKGAKLRCFAKLSELAKGYTYNSKQIYLHVNNQAFGWKLDKL